jgi:lycopene cyclase domain-containing protein
MEYLLIQLGFLIISIFLVCKYKLKIFKSKKHAFILLGVIFLLIIIWDSTAVFYGWWKFPGTGLIGITIGLLPIEEYSLAIIVPWFIVVFYKFIEEKLK